jgi:hypothetical protein
MLSTEPGFQVGAQSIPPLDPRLIVQVSPSFFTDLANTAWALQKKSCDPISSERKEEFRGIARHIDHLSECLEEIGIRIQSHTNEVFDSGQSLEVIAFQPTPGITQEIVVETVRPTVYIKDNRIQMGQVIVATPDYSQEDSGNV